MHQDKPPSWKKSLKHLFALHEYCIFM